MIKIVTVRFRGYTSIGESSGGDSASILQIAPCLFSLSSSVEWGMAARAPIWILVSLWLSVAKPAQPHLIAGVGQTSARVDPVELVNALTAALKAPDDAELFRRFESAITAAAKSQSNELGTALAEAISSLPMQVLAQGEVERAASITARFLQTAEKTFGSDHPFVAEALSASAEIAHQAGEDDRAESFATRAVEIADRIYSDDVAVAYFYDLRGRILHYRAKWYESEASFQHALNVSWKKSEREDLDIARITSNLAAMYSDSGRDSDAEILFLRSIGIQDSLAPDSPDLAATLNGLGGVYLEQQRYSEAVPVFEKAVAIFEKQAGFESDLAAGLTNLGQTYSVLRRFDEAEAAMRRALVIKERTLGSEHPSVSFSLNNLAGLLSRQKKDDEAEKYYLKALAIREKTLGPEHPDVATILVNLGTLYSDHGRYEESEAFFNRALAIQKKTLDANHPKLLWLLEAWSDSLRRQGKDGAADELDKQAEKIRALR